MNCQSFEGIVSDLARGQAMEASVRGDALVHSGECERCALKLEDQRLLADRLRALAAEMMSAEAPARVEVQVLAAFRNDKVPTSPALSITRRRWVAAVAAVVLLVVGLVVMRIWLFAGREPEHDQIVKQVETPESTTMVKRNDASPVAIANDPPRPLAVSGARRRTNGYLAGLRVSSSARRGDSARQANAVVPDSRDREIATEFFPVGSGSALSLQDGGQLVRVELPRSTLARFGLPVNVSRASQRIKADVLMGVDGQARAIRFVQ